MNRRGEHPKLALLLVACLVIGLLFWAYKIDESVDAKDRECLENGGTVTQVQDGYTIVGKAIQPNIVHGCEMP